MRVTRVIEPGSPLAVGDVIVTIDGESVRASAPTDEDVFAAMIRRFRVGATVSSGSTVRAGRWRCRSRSRRCRNRPARWRSTNPTDFEFSGRDLVDADAADPRLTGASQGVLVESVSSGGWAALGRLSVGDIILQVDGRAIGNVADLAARLDHLSTSRPAAVLVQVRRGIRTMFLEIRPEWRKQLTNSK